MLTVYCFRLLFLHVRHNSGIFSLPWCGVAVFFVRDSCHVK